MGAVIIAAQVVQAFLCISVLQLVKRRYLITVVYKCVYEVESERKYKTVNFNRVIVATEWQSGWRNGLQKYLLTFLKSHFNTVS